MFAYNAFKSIYLYRSGSYNSIGAPCSNGSTWSNNYWCDNGLCRGECLLLYVTVHSSLFTLTPLERLINTLIVFRSLTIEILHQTFIHYIVAPSYPKRYV